jgi:hypothetical protein
MSLAKCLCRRFLL